MPVAEEIYSESTMAESTLPCGINRLLLPIKAYYFVFMAGVGDLLPFIALYMQQLGFNTTETGIIYGVMPFVGFFMRPVIGAVADKFHRHKLVLIIVTCLTGLMYMLLVIVPQRPPPNVMSVTTTLKCNTQDSFLQDCTYNSNKEKCIVGLSQLAQLPSFSLQNNTSSKCVFKCQSNKEGMGEIQACFTNETSPFDGQACNGVLMSGKYFEFTVNNLQSVINAEITQHTPANCKIFDLKDIHYESEAWQILCDHEVDLDCIISCESHICEVVGEPYDKSFFLFFFLFLMANIAFAPIFPILDAATYDILGEQRHLWGKQRLWGTFGFAIFAVTSTFVMYFWRKTNDDVNYTYSFYIFGVLSFIAAFLANFIKFSSDIKCGEFIKNVWKLLSLWEVSVFLFVIMYFGFVLGGLEAFLFWFLTDLGSSPLVFGFMLVVNCIAEVPMLWIAGFIIKRIGLIASLYLALVCCGIRLLAYSLLQEPWLVLLVEPVHGVTFALMYAAASLYASVISPPGMSATVQGLLGGVHFGFGKGIGSLITGFLFECIGPRWTWRLFSIISIVILLIYFLLNTFVFNSQHASTKEPGCGGNNGEETQHDQQLVSPANEANASSSMDAIAENHLMKP